MSSLACNEKIIAMLKQHPEGGEKFFNALDLMIRSDKNIIESFCLLIKEFLSSGRSTSTCAVLSGHFGRYMLNTCSNFLKNNFNEILLVNGGIRTGNKVELDYLPKSKNLVFIDDSIYSGNTRDQIIKALNKTVRFGEKNYILTDTFVVYDGMKIRQLSTHAMFRYYDQENIK